MATYPASNAVMSSPNLFECGSTKRLEIPTAGSTDLRSAISFAIAPPTMIIITTTDVFTIVVGVATAEAVVTNIMASEPAFHTI